MSGRYDLTDIEWSIIKPLLPNKPRGVPRVNGSRVLNGIFWVSRSGGFVLKNQEPCFMLEVRSTANCSPPYELIQIFTISNISDNHLQHFFTIMRVVAKVE